jgi:hypothetical protein
VIEDAVNVPAARSWRDIPQPVKTRAMSSSGRWRRVFAGARATTFALLVSGLTWGTWMVVTSLRENSPTMPAIAKSVPMKPPVLKTTRDGVLDSAWLGRTLALPGRISLPELNLDKLRERVLADGQVLTANLAREYPDRLVVHVTERTPVARVRVGQPGSPRDLLVAPDGVLFAGTGFDPAMVEALPWLGGLSLVPEGKGYRKIARMDVVSRLLTDAQLAAEHLYRSWQIVSLARLESDDELEVTTKDNTTIVFSAKGEFFVQLANLDYVIEQRAHLPPAKTRIDLSLGREVPVMVEPSMATLDAAADAARHVRSPFVPALPPSQLKTKREL